VQAWGEDGADSKPRLHSGMNGAPSRESKPSEDI
jgi:hypothetical protein